MLLGRYVFLLTFDDDAVLPEYKGSTFRGVFGHSLRKVVCAMKQQECADCLLREKCLYFQVFEIQTDVTARRGEAGEGAFVPGKNAANSEDPIGAGVRKRIVAPPHPYVIEPGPDIRTRYRSGETFDFTLLLFGGVNEFLAYFIYAFNEMGKLGVGKAINGGRASFHLNRVTSGERLVFDSGDRQIHKGPFTEELSLMPPDGGNFSGNAIGDFNTSTSGKAIGNAVASHGENPVAQSSGDSGVNLPSEALKPALSELTIRLQTPLRLKFENHFKAGLPFHLLVRAMLRRAASLEQTFGNGEPALDYQGLVRRANDISITSSTIKWFDWKRYSNRQDQAMLMGGMTGDVTYTGDINEFLPLLRFCEKAHIGKQTAFGLGKITLLFPPEDVP